MQSGTAQFRTSVTLAVVLSVSLLSGCTPEPEFRLNAVHKRTVEKEFMEGQPIPEQQVLQMGNLVTALFGTPAEPRFPSQLADVPLVDPANLALAAGPVASDRSGEHTGLYREHCAHCHGVSGDGAGPTALFLNPYPRDFRLGKFKFKATRMYRPPTDDDLLRIIREGIPGTAMPSFRLLDEKEQLALVDYVKYLAIRGRVERTLLDELTRLDADEPLVESPRTADEDDVLDQLGFVIDDIVIPELERWTDPEDNLTEVPERPRNFTEMLPQLATSGRSLFFGKGNCAQCHGATGMGDGQTQNYDDWTNEWLKRAKVDENSPDEIAEFTQLGALPPRKLRPRNLGLRVFRGGGEPEDLYRRIADGIEGTPMPAASGLEPDEVWALVAYVLELGNSAYEETRN